MSNSSKIYAATNAAVLRHIPTNATILDIGCGGGYLSQQIKRKGNTLYGLDYAKEAVERAAKRIDHAVVCNMEKENIPWKEEFDVIVFADILEHLQHPQAAIKKARKQLKKEGIIIISLPNVANWSIRLQLLFGNFKRTETGILDRTHIHFYTLKTAKEMIEQSDLEIKEIDLNPNFVMTPVRYFLRLLGKELAITDYEVILESHMYKRYTQYIQPLETIFARLWKPLFAYQFVFVCHENFRQVPPKSKKARFDRRLQI